MNADNHSAKKGNWTFLSEFPTMEGRYVIIDTETTGLSPHYNNIIEIAAVEVYDGKITGAQFHAYLQPRNRIDPRAQEVHKMSNSFYQEYFTDVYKSDKTTMENFLKFVGDSIVFAHNATFDCQFVNNELEHWKLPIIKKERFRCTMRIFKDIFSKVDSNCKKLYSLVKCCDYFKMKAPGSFFHSAIFDSFMTARLLCQMLDYTYKKNLEDPKMDKEAEKTLKEIQISKENNSFAIHNINEIPEITHPKIDENSDVNAVMEFNQCAGEENISNNTETTKEEKHINEHESCDRDILLIQKNVDFISDYMKESKEIIKEKQIIGDSQERNVTNEKIEKNIINMNSNQQTKGKIDGGFQSLPFIKYKDLMRKYVNSVSKNNDMKSSFEKMKERTEEGILSVTLEDIEEISKAQ